MYPKKNKNLQYELAQSAYQRMNQRSQKILDDQKTLQVLNHGVTPLYHPAHHNFRSENKEKELHMSNVYVKNYKPAKDRSADAQNDFKSTHLHHTPYHTGSKFFGRDKSVEKELGPPMRYGTRTEYERINISLRDSRLLDNEIKDTQMIHYPEWKPTQKDKWTSKKDFDLTANYPNVYTALRSKDPWRQSKDALSKGDPYHGGFETTGDISRKREDTKEISKKTFNMTVSPSTEISSFMAETNSVRGGKLIKFIDEANEKHQKLYPNSVKHMQVETSARDPRESVALSIELNDKEMKNPILPKLHVNKTSTLRSYPLEVLPENVSQRSHTSNKILTTLANSFYSNPTHHIRTNSQIKETLIKAKVGAYFS
jgi:hypothetical protein